MEWFILLIVAFSRRPSTAAVFLVLVLWRARGAGRCLRELWRAVRALLRALGRCAALNLSSAVTNRLLRFQPSLRAALCDSAVESASKRALSTLVSSVGRAAT